MDNRRSFGGAEEIPVADLALADEQPTDLVADAAQALYEVADALAAMLVAPVVLEAERRVRSARARRAAVASARRAA